MRHVNWSVIGGIVLLCLAFIWGAESERRLGDKTKIVILFESVNLAAEPVKKEFENTIVLSVFHLYDDYNKLNADYRELVKPDEDKETVWGWSECEWLPDHNYSACDIYVVRPKFVDDVSMDVIGHEVWHGVSGEFHE